ncbi:MAG TPA: phosphotransferase [Usitatibacter sp.]|nr:phosphotransferase [Usitatibacter sp.]
MDPRFRALEAWLGTVLPGAVRRIEPASADASFRRYFRAILEDGTTRIVMDAPPEREASTPQFVRIAALIREAGLNAPQVFEQDLAQGFLLLADLGTTSYLAALQAGSPDALFGDATTALVRWQAASRPGVLPEYDEAMLRREMELFPDWYIGRHLGMELAASQRESLESVFRIVLANNLAQPRVFVHRDFMPRNLMVSRPNPGILDFQDATFGPIGYDIACLFRDAYVSWDEERVLDGTIRYWEKARRAGLPVRADFAHFWRDVEWMGLQRHLKVAGIFARLAHRDGKRGYVEDTPRFIGYLRHAVSRYDELAPLGRLLDNLEGVKPRIGYTF